jgi:carbon storage regulator CsrA
MLVLGRNVNKSITVTCPTGEKIKFTILANRPGSQVKIGIDAPEYIKILRDELIPNDVPTA